MILCLTYNEAEKHKNLEVWSGERFTAGPVRGRLVSAFKTPNSKSSQQGPYLGKGKEGVVSCGKCLGVTASVFEAGHCHNALVNLHQTNFPL